MSSFALKGIRMRRFALFGLNGMAAIVLTATAVLTGTVFASGTDHLGPFAGNSLDGGSCGNSWANDTYDLFATVHDNNDGTFTVGVDYKDGSFTTLPGFSPGACSPSLHHGSFVLGGITGSFQGWVAGTVTAATYNPNGCDVPSVCTTRTTMIQALFPGGSYDITSFNFEYQSSDGTLSYRHWQDKSAKDSGEKFEGDIATS
jgi:hypothetical protein